MLLLAALAVWEVGKNPDGIRSLLQNSESSDVEQELSADDKIEGDPITATSGLSAAERAIAEVDELERLIKDLDINITVNPDKPQSKSRASSRQKPSGTSPLTLEPQLQEKLGDSNEYPRVVEGTTNVPLLPTPADTSFYHPSTSIDRSKPKDENLPVHPLKSALERLSTTNSTGLSATPVLPKPEVRPDELRPGAYGAIAPYQSASEQLRPSAYGTIVPSQSASNQLRPGADGAIGRSALPSNSAIGKPQTPNTYSPVPIDSYNYRVQTAPGEQKPFPYLIAPVGSPGLTPQPGLPNPNPGVTNNLYNQPQQQPLTTPVPFSNSTQEQTIPRDGDIIDRFLNP